MANQFLGLSLFIMLLSFFIILNAVSNFEETKSKPVLNSLALTFSNKEAVDATPPGSSPIKTVTLQEGSTLDKIESLFRSQITNVQLKQNRLGTIMYARVPFKDFEKAIRKSLVISSENRPAEWTENLDVLPMLVSLLETQRDTTYKMDMLLNISQSPSSLMTQAPEEFSVQNKKISGLAHILEQAGLPKHQVTAGLKQGEDGIVELLFRRYQPFNPLHAMNQHEEAAKAAVPAGGQEAP